MDPRRRRLCRALAVVPLASVAGCLSGLPTATGPRNPPDEAPPTRSGGDGDDPVSVTSTDVLEGENGHLLVAGEVRNRSGAPATRTVVVEATVDDDTVSASEEVTVPANGTTEFRVTVPMDYQRFNDGGALNVSLV
jgi:hypothetical protein